MNFTNLPYFELESFRVGDTDDLSNRQYKQIKELKVPYDILPVVLVVVELVTALPSSYTR